MFFNTKTNAWMYLSTRYTFNVIYREVMKNVFMTIFSSTTYMLQFLQFLEIKSYVLINENIDQMNKLLHCCWN